MGILTKSISLSVCISIGLLFSILFVLFIVQIDAGTLEGIVKGYGGAPKRYVRIEMYGPDSVYTFTDENGRFIVNVRDGEYKVQISERDRVMHFEVKVPGRSEFVLSWR